MEEYINKDNIVSVRTCGKQLMDNIFSKTIKEKKFLWFKLWDEYTVYAFEPHCSGYYTSTDLLGLIRQKYGSSFTNVYIFDEFENKVYRKPFIEFNLNSKRTLCKYFDTEKEMETYLSSLKLKCLENCIKF